MTDKEERELERRKKIATRLFTPGHDDRATLERFRMKRIAAFGFDDENRMYVRVEPDASQIGPGVYAFVVAHRVIRTGSAAGGVGRRLRDYPIHINTALARDGRQSPAPLWESELWLHVLQSYGEGRGEVWGRPSEPIATDIGIVPEEMACKAEEFLVQCKFPAPPLKHPLLNRRGRIT